MKGLGVSPGYACAPALIYTPGQAQPDETLLPPQRAEEEKHRFLWAVEQAAKQLEQLEWRAKTLFARQEAVIFSAHQQLLDDPALHGRVDACLARGHCAAYAVEQTMKDICVALEKLDAPLLRERAVDVRDVCKRLILILMGLEQTDISKLERDCILVAEELSPSDTVQMDLEHIKGIVTERGGPTAHAAILARSLALPAVVGVQDATKRIVPGELLLLDGQTGQVLRRPDDLTVAAYEKRAKEAARRELPTAVPPTLTQAGRPLRLCANIASGREAEGALRYGPDGVGLFRTEFLFLGRDSMPTEQQQLDQYRQVAQIMAGRPVTMRTLDIGGDKGLDYLPFDREDNPALGWRGIRVCLDQEQLFLTQLRALLRASAFGEVSILYPMITCLDQVDRANELLQRAREQLAQRGQPFGTVQVGAMIETPAAAMMAGELARAVDFFSIGTNDLIQYTLAADRGNQRVAHLYDFCHPAVLRLVHRICQAGHEAGIRVRMCGEAAGDEGLTGLLLGLGLDELSMVPTQLPQVRQAAAEISVTRTETLARRALDCCGAREVRGLLSK